MHQPSFSPSSCIPESNLAPRFFSSRRSAGAAIDVHPARAISLLRTWCTIERKLCIQDTYIDISAVNASDGGKADDLEVTHDLCIRYDDV